MVSKPAMKKIMLSIGAILLIFPLLCQAAPKVIRLYSHYGQMEAPDISMCASGKSMIVWQDNTDKGYDIFSQRFDENGLPSGTIVRMNQYTINGQKFPKVAMDSQGNGVVVWQSYGEDSSGSGIFGQRFTNQGWKTGSEFKANTYIRDNQESPRVSMNSSGNFAVAWVSEKQDGVFKTVHAQFFDSAGKRVGKEFKVSQGTDGNAVTPAIALDNSNRLMAVWTKEDKNSSNIYGQIFTWDGKAVMKIDIPVSIALEDQGHPEIIPLPSNQFMAVWENTILDSKLNYPLENIEGQIFSAAGQKSGKEFQVTTPFFGHQENPQMIQVTNSQMLVAWQEFSKSTNDWSIKGQALKPNGQTESEKFSFEKGFEWNESPVLATDGKATIGIAWIQRNEESGKKMILLKREPASSFPPITTKKEGVKKD